MHPYHQIINSQALHSFFQFPGYPERSAGLENVMNFMCGFSSRRLPCATDFPISDRWISHLPSLTCPLSLTLSLLAGFLIIFSSSTAPLERHSHNRGMEFQVFFACSRFLRRFFSFLSLGFIFYEAVHCFRVKRLDKRDDPVDGDVKIIS